MNPKQYLLADPANVFEGSRDRKGMLQAFRDMYEVGMEEMHDFCTSHGKLSISCPCKIFGISSSKTKVDSGFFISSSSGILAVFFRPEGWSDDEARLLRGAPYSARATAERACHKISERL